MKDLIIRGMALIVCVSLGVSCQVSEIEITPSGDSQSAVSNKIYTLTAYTGDEVSRTTMDGYNINWAANDGLTIWHADAGTTTYVKDNQFKTTMAGHVAEFSGTLNEVLSAENNYDWYILYPWKPALLSPEGDGSGFVGSHNVGVAYQEQENLNSKAHLAGTENLIYAVIKDVTGDEIPAVTMKPLNSAVRVHVANTSGEPIRIHTITMTSPDGIKIAGQHAINFTTTPPTLTERPSSSYDRIRLNITGESAIANSASADFYFSLKPFTASSGKTIKINVNGYEHDYTMPSDKVFQSGKIKTINFTYDRAATDYSGVYFIYGNGTGTNSGKTFLAEARDYEAKVLGSGSNHVCYAFPVTVEGSTLTHYADMMTHDGDAAANIDAYKFTFSKVAAGTYAGMYTIANSEGKYLATTRSDANNLVFQAGLDENSYWDVSPDDSGGWKIVATKSDNRRFLMFNYLDAGYPRITAFAASDDKNPTQVKLSLVSSYTLNVITNPAAYVRVKETLVDFENENYLLVYMSDPNNGLAFCTDATYNDNGSVYEAVSIKYGKIAYNSTLSDKCKLKILKHAADDSKEVFDTAQDGKYTLFRQNGNGFGIYARSGLSDPDDIRFNYNSKYGRFCYTIEYDPSLNEGGENFAPGGMELSMKNNAATVCFIRYNTDTKRFVIGAKSLFGSEAKYKNVQLFKLVGTPD